MKLIILHLSDMHFSKKNSYQPVNIDAIVAALQQSVFEVQHIIILVSGDLAYSGKKSAYTSRDSYEYHQMQEPQMHHLSRAGAPAQV